ASEESALLEALRAPDWALNHQPALRRFVQLRPEHDCSPYHEDSSEPVRRRDSRSSDRSSEPPPCKSPESSAPLRRTQPSTDTTCAPHLLHRQLTRWTLHPRGNQDSWRKA